MRGPEKIETPRTKKLDIILVVITAGSAQTIEADYGTSAHTYCISPNSRAIVIVAETFFYSEISYGAPQKHKNF